MKSLSFCLTCGSEIYYYPSTSKGKFCTYECYWKNKKGKATGKSWNTGLTKETDERVRKQSVKMLGRKQSEETRRKRRLALKGKPRPEVSIGLKLAYKEGRRKSRKGKTYEEIYGVIKASIIRNKIGGKGVKKPGSGWCRGLTKETDLRIKKLAESISRGRKGIIFSDAHRRNISLSLCGKRKSPESIMKRNQSLLKQPSSYEQKIIDLINKYGLVFKYIGDGKQIIGHVNPDFIDVLELKPPLIIEVYHDYFHQGKYELVRYKQLQIPKENVLFLKDEDIQRKDWEIHCLKRIREFVRKNTVNFHPLFQYNILRRIR